MNKNTLLKDLNIGFSKLDKEGQEHILVISKALLFAQTIQKNSFHKKGEAVSDQKI